MKVVVWTASAGRLEFEAREGWKVHPRRRADGVLEIAEVEKGPPDVDPTRFVPKRRLLALVTEPFTMVVEY